MTEYYYRRLQTHPLKTFACLSACSSWKTFLHHIYLPKEWMPQFHNHGLQERNRMNLSLLQSLLLHLRWGWLLNINNGNQRSLLLGIVRPAGKISVRVYISYIRGQLPAGRNAFFLDHQYSCPEVTCKPAIATCKYQYKNSPTCSMFDKICTGLRVWSFTLWSAKPGRAATVGVFLIMDWECLTPLTIPLAPLTLLDRLCADNL